MAGVTPPMPMFGVYAICGGLAGLAGIVFSLDTSAGYSLATVGVELDGVEGGYAKGLDGEIWPSRNALRPVGLEKAPNRVAFFIAQTLFVNVELLLFLGAWIVKA